MGLENYSKEIQKKLKQRGITVGTRVEIIKNNIKYDGLLMPRSELGDNSCLVIKRDDGYNIGIKFERGMNVKRISYGKKLEAFPSIKIRQKKGLPQISMVVTGGTISSRIDYQTGGVKWLMKPEQLFFLAPELGNIVRIRKIEKPFSIASENMSAKYWIKIAKITAKLLNEGDEGVIITHGTDTLHFTSAALAFMLKNLHKPVVLTYSQRSTDRGSTDSSMNLICSAYVACSDIGEVVLVGHGEINDTFCLINRGVGVRKMHTSRRDTFRPINTLPIGRVWPNGKIEIINNYRKKEKCEVIADTKFEEKISIVKYYPGANPEIIDFLVDKKYRGIVIEVTGLGHVATDESEYNWIPSLKRAIENGVTICAVPQTLYGRLDPFVYSEGRKIWKLGVIYCNMLPETTYIKLGCVLAKTCNLDEVKKLMLTNMTGEIIKRIKPETFLY